MLLAGVGDARRLSRLGIQTYGYNPTETPPGFDFWKLLHAADERIPVETLDFRVDAIYKLLQRLGQGA